MDEYVNLVDEQNQVIGKASRKEAVEKSLRFQVARIFTFNEKGELLIHLRALEKSADPGKWDLSIAETVQYGETMEEAAKRGIKEEIGAEAIALRHVSDSVCMDDTKRKVYGLFTCKVKGPFVLQKEEVSEIEFVSVSQLPQLLKERDFKKNAIGLFEEFQRHEKA